jgi:preprotein translocase subunit YajC
MFISPAFAQDAGASPATSFVQFVPLVLIFVVFYFLLIRPQQKKLKEHKAMLEAVRRGDRVITNGGIIGLVTKVNAEKRELTVEIADNVRVQVAQDMITSVVSKTEPVSDKADAKTDEKN